MLILISPSTNWWLNAIPARLRQYPRGLNEKQSDRIRTSTTGFRNHLPVQAEQSRGLWVTPERNETYDRITAIIQRETLPCEPILIFPQTPIFYLLADRPMMGHAVVHWFDFLPDNLARKEMHLLETQPPALIMYMEMPEEVYLAHEKLFRAGRPSAQREILAKIHQMQSEGTYDEIAVIPLHSNFTFRIMKRK